MDIRLFKIILYNLILSKLVYICLFNASSGMCLDWCRCYSYQITRTRDKNQHSNSACTPWSKVGGQRRFLVKLLIFLSQSAIKTSQQL
jgi:hypothetical protein